MRLPVTAVILAGGRGSRMGGADKGLLELEGRPLAAHLAAALAPRVDELLISANRNLDRYAALGHPVLRDALEGFQGPLAGMLRAMRQARNPFLLVVPCDAPHLPPDHVQRMFSTLRRQDARIAVAHDGHRRQAVHALLETGLADDLARFLDTGQRSVLGWYARHPLVDVDFSDAPSAFFDADTPEALERLAGRRQATEKQGRATTRIPGKRGHFHG